MAVSDQVSLMLFHNFRPTSSFFLIRRSVGITALTEPLPRDETEDDACDIVCQHCGATVLVRYGSMASVRRAQARWNVVLGSCVVTMIASVAYFASHASRELPEGTPLPLLFPLSMLGIGVAFVLGGLALVARHTQRVAAIGPDKGPHSASGRAVPVVSPNARAVRGHGQPS